MVNRSKDPERASPEDAPPFDGQGTQIRGWQFDPRPAALGFRRFLASANPKVPAPIGRITR